MSKKIEMSDEELNSVNGGIQMTNMYGNFQEYRVGYVNSLYYTHTFPKTQKATVDSIIKGLNEAGAFAGKTQDQIDDIVFAALNAPGSGVTLTPLATPIKK